MLLIEAQGSRCVKRLDLMLWSGGPNVLQAASTGSFKTAVHTDCGLEIVQIHQTGNAVGFRGQFDRHLCRLLHRCLMKSPIKSPIVVPELLLGICAEPQSQCRTDPDSAIADHCTY